MGKKIEILFIDKIFRFKAENKTTKVLSQIFTVALYPFIIVGGLLIMLFFIPLSIWQKLTMSKSEKRQLKADEEERLKALNRWTIFYQTTDLIIHQRLAGSLPWDSGDYFYLSSTPEIRYLQDKLFGEWFLVDFGGIFLQRWNHEREIDCILVFISFYTLEEIILKTGIPTKSWIAERLNVNEIRFTFLTSDADIIYVVRQTSDDNWLSIS